MKTEDWTWSDIAREWTGDPDDRERQACWHLLSLLGERTTGAFVGQDCPAGLDAEQLLAIRWSETEREIARAPASLFNSSAEVNLGRIARLFSDTQMERLDTSVAIYRGRSPPPVDSGDAPELWSCPDQVDTWFL